MPHSKTYLLGHPNDMEPTFGITITSEDVDISDAVNMYCFILEECDKKYVILDTICNKYNIFNKPSNFMFFNWSYALDDNNHLCAFCMSKTTIKNIVNRFVELDFEQYEVE